MIHRTEHVELIYSENESDYIVVTFNGIGTRADGKRFWGDAFLKKNGISALGIVSTERNWFPRESMEEICEVARPILSRYRHRCTYGASMGAYGAVKYSRMLGADTVVAFSPQYTINPSLENASFTYFYNEKLHQDVTIVPADLGGRIIVFFDPFHAADNYAARYIKKNGTDVHLVPLPFIGHTTIFPFAKAGQGLPVLKLSIEDKIDELKKLACNARREFGGILRIYNVVRQLVKTHARWALAMCLKYPDALDGKRLDGFCQELKRWNQLPLAIAWAREFAAQNPFSSIHFRNLAGFLRFNGDFLAAKEAINQALDLEPENHRYMLERSYVASDAGDVEEAVLWGNNAIKTAPRDPSGFHHVALLLSKNGFLEKAIETMREALKVHPNNNTFNILLETWEKGQFDKLDDEVVAGLNA